MADQTQRSPKQNNYPSNSPIAGLRGEITAGASIDAADINGLINLINGWIGHTHVYDDAYQLATFGNTGDRTDYYEDKTTGNSGLFGIDQVSAGSVVTADKHNQMRNTCNNLRGHDHVIDDRAS